jgi:LAS superfamily LD-carboxypeptidase LdcB
MTHPESQPTLTLRAAGRFVAVAMVLVVVVSCAARGHAVSTVTTSDLGSDSRQFTAQDGYIADGERLTPFDTDHPAVGNLDRDLLHAVQRAWTDAARDGVDMVINSGWRSERYQQGLLDDAVVRYGSKAEARKWVDTPKQSTHVTGNAVDIGPADADSWLSQHGNEYGLCQIYANEMWHYEFAIEPGGTCPRQISNASVGRYHGT